jgi:hypothetical protein
MVAFVGVHLGIDRQHDIVLTLNVGGALADYRQS